MIFQYETRTYELYDLTNDLSETTDLVALEPAKAFELSAALSSYLAEVKPSTPILKSSGLAVALPPVLWPTVQGDFDGVNGIDVADWMQLKSAFASDISQLSLTAGYAAGDITLDGNIDRFDFALFKSQYNLVHGVGAFEALVARVPEPATIGAAVFAAIGLLGQRRHRGARRPS